MKSHVLNGVLAIALLAGVFTPVLAQKKDPHPTATALHRFGRRNTARTVHAVNHAGAHMHNYKHRKEHKFRAWLNKH